MQNTPLPRDHRIAYAADVRLLASDGDQPFQGQIVQTVNLSRSGVLVECDRSWAVGSEVLCEFPLPEEVRKLPGRVSRVEPLAGDRVRLAVQFVQLEQPDLEFLSRLLNDPGGAFHLVRVRFEGMRQPMRARATVTDEGINLSTALSFLRLRSPVEVTFPPGWDRSPSRGRITDVKLDRWHADGVPRLAVRVERTLETPGLADTPRPEANGQSARRQWARAALGFLAGLTITGLVTLAYKRLGPERPGREAASRDTIGEPAAQTTRTAPISSPIPSPSSAPPGSTPTTDPAKPVVAGGSAGAGPAQRPNALDAAPAVLIPLPHPPGTPGPDVQRVGQEVTATVPVTGSTGGMSHYSLAERRGLAVNLPHARSDLAPGLHRVGHDGLGYVWIRERREGGLHIRFVFTSPPPDERLLELEDNLVRIRVRLPGPSVGDAPAGTTPPEPLASEAPLPSLEPPSLEPPSLEPPSLEPPSLEPPPGDPPAAQVVPADSDDRALEHDDQDPPLLIAQPLSADSALPAPTPAAATAP